ncbi:hypothetical protein HDU76_006187, partial [Blyttiomyces sp. JEL0837]
MQTPASPFLASNRLSTTTSTTKTTYRFQPLAFLQYLLVVATLFAIPTGVNAASASLNILTVGSRCYNNPTASQALCQKGLICDATHPPAGFSANDSPYGTCAPIAKEGQPCATKDKNPPACDQGLVCKIPVTSMNGGTCVKPSTVQQQTKPTTTPKPRDVLFGGSCTSDYFTKGAITTVDKKSSSYHAYTGPALVCKKGFMCDAKLQYPGTCRRAASYSGAPCTTSIYTSGEKNAVCVPAVGLTCFASAPNSRTGVCRKLVGKGEKCGGSTTKGDVCKSPLQCVYVLANGTKLNPDGPG